MPLNFEKAYDNETRAFNGEPGEKYWQNRSDYKIKADYNPKTHLLSGEETIHYFNNSPDSLKRIVIIFYQERFKKGGMRDFSVNSDYIHDGTTIAYLKIDGKDIQMEGKKKSIRSSPKI